MCNAFYDNINHFSILTWKIYSPSSLVDFIDLALVLTVCVIEYLTHQKKLNLYLHLLPMYAHLPGYTKGDIYNPINYHKATSPITRTIPTPSLFFLIVSSSKDGTITISSILSFNPVVPLSLVAKNQTQVSIKTLENTQIFIHL